MIKKIFFIIYYCKHFWVGIRRNIFRPDTPGFWYIPGDL